MERSVTYDKQKKTYRAALSRQRTGARIDTVGNGAGADEKLCRLCRKMLIDGYIIQVDHTDIKAMTAEIQKIVVNVNQIAKCVNATGSVYEQDIAEIKGALSEIWRLQRLSLLKRAKKALDRNILKTVINTLV